MKTSHGSCLFTSIALKHVEFIIDKQTRLTEQGWITPPFLLELHAHVSDTEHQLDSEENE